MSAPLLQTKDLQLAFGAVVVADHIDFSLAKGERLAVIGQNGAGKTTFINICTGLIRPQAGSVYFEGEEVTRLAPRAIALRGMVRSFQLPQLFSEHTVRDCVRIAAAGKRGGLGLWTPLERAVPAAAVEHVLEIVGLAGRGDELSGALPEGQRKLLDIAMALILEPRLLILDEPTSGVSTDEKHGLMKTIMAALDEQNVTAIFVEHDVDIVSQYATRVAAWIAGRIAADGRPEQVLSDPLVRKNVIGNKMLKINQVSAQIAGIPVLRNIHTEFKAGQLLAVVGRNGAGKTTLLRAIMGLLPLSAGSIEIDGTDLTPVAAHRRTAFGIGYAPEDRVMFPTFTVEENLRLPSQVLGLSKEETDRRLARVTEAVPQLREMLPRSGAALSGGQGKIAALGRALMAGSRLVLLDEPFQGLAPVLAVQYAESLRRLHELAPELCIVVTESNRSLLRDLPDATLTLERGELITMQ